MSETHSMRPSEMEVLQMRLASANKDFREFKEAAIFVCNDKDAEITRLRAELERVRGQRDKALIDLATKNHDILFADLPMAQCVTLADHGFRVLSYHGTRTVEEIES